MSTGHFWERSFIFKPIYFIFERRDLSNNKTKAIRIALEKGEGIIK
jgi:hypothetical protein